MGLKLAKNRWVGLLLVWLGLLTGCAEQSSPVPATRAFIPTVTPTASQREQPTSQSSVTSTAALATLAPTIASPPTTPVATTGLALAATATASSSSVATATSAVTPGLSAPSTPVLTVAATPVATPTFTTIASTPTPAAATARPIATPTVAPTKKPFAMSNSVTLAPPPAPFLPIVTPPALAQMDLTEFGHALNPESQPDLAMVAERQPPLYNIALKVAPDPQKPVAAGHEQIFYTNNTGGALPNVILWLYANAPNTDTHNPPLAVSNVKVDGQFATTQLENDAANLDIMFEAAHPLQPGATVGIELDFKLDVPTDLESGYFRYDAANNIFALLYWYPQVAVFDRKLTDGWDIHPYNVMGDTTNSNVALFKVWLTAPASEVIAANGVSADSRLNTDGTRTTLFVSGPVRDFVASLSPNYQTATQQVGSTAVTSYFLGRDKVFGTKALGFAANAFQTYRDAFGRYPYTKFNVVEAPLVPWGGLEFPGEVYITTRYYEPSYLTSFEFAVIHETGHQWWYGMVGSDQIRAPWQDEALTQYCGLLYYERFRDVATVQKIYHSYFRDAYVATLDSKQDGIVARDVYAYKDISSYAIIAYNKGGLFYDAYRKQFGEAAFSRFVRYYLEHNRYKFVGTDALLDALKQGVDNSSALTTQVTELYRHWILAAEGAQDRAKL